MDGPIEVLDSHECTVLKKYNAGLNKQRIDVQRFRDAHWYWVRSSDKRGNKADGIAYCPYCGQKL